VFEQAGVVDARACQELLGSLGDVFEADTFHFDGGAQDLCRLLASSSHSCSALSGPRLPHFSSCATATTSTATPPSPTTTGTAVSSTAPASTTTLPEPTDFSAVLWFGGSVFTPGQQRNEAVHLVTAERWCPLPDTRLPRHGSGLLAASLGRKMLLCGFPSSTRGGADTACYVATGLATGGGWTRVSDRIFSNGLSAWAVTGTSLLATAGILSADQGNAFESLELGGEEGAAWVREDITLPNVPPDRHISGSCMVALDSHRVMLLGGGWMGDVSVGGHLTQVLDRRTGGWRRLADLSPPRMRHACLAWQGGVLVTGGLVAGSVPSAAAQLFNLTSEKWEELPPLEEARSEHILVEVDGRPTVIGGEGAARSERWADGAWRQHVEHTPVVMLSGLQVPGGHCTALQWESAGLHQVDRLYNSRS
jgi:hypothetical protein